MTLATDHVPQTAPVRSRRRSARNPPTRRRSGPSPMPSGPISSGSCRPTARSPSPSAAATSRSSSARRTGRRFPHPTDRRPHHGTRHPRTPGEAARQRQEFAIATCPGGPLVQPGRRGNLARERARSRRPGHRPLPRRSRNGLPRDRQRRVSELEAFQGPFGLGIERDLWFNARGVPLSTYAEAARRAGHIVEFGPEIDAAAARTAGTAASPS